MGILFSREKSDSKDYEQVLEKLDIDIQKVEGRLSEVKIKQRKASFLWIIYSLVIWIACLFYLFYKFADVSSTTQDIAIGLLPVILLPVGIYNVRKLLVWWYEQRQKKEETLLAKLRKEQKDKLEDLKNKTSYYKTQSLLEKYDDAILKKKKEQERLLQQQKKPVSLPVRPNHAQPPQFPPPRNNSQQQQQQMRPMNQQPVFPQPRSEPQWYDKIVDALVGETGPETKYALICNHCFSHNGLVLKEEYDTIQYICPVCKQFNPSRKSKQDIIQQQKQEQLQHQHEEEKPKAEPVIEEEEEQTKEVLTEEEINRIKQENLNDESTIASRVRQRHKPTTQEEE